MMSHAGWAKQTNNRTSHPSQVQIGSQSEKKIDLGAQNKFRTKPTPLLRRRCRLSAVMQQTWTMLVDETLYRSISIMPQ